MLLTWRQNPKDPNSFLAEYANTRFEVVFDEAIGSDELEWSYAYILPARNGIEDVEGHFENHYFTCDTKETAMNEAEKIANDIKNGDE
jgi:hypothetical protein